MERNSGRAKPGRGTQAHSRVQEEEWPQGKVVRHAAQPSNIEEKETKGVPVNAQNVIPLLMGVIHTNQTHCAQRK